MRRGQSWLNARFVHPGGVVQDTQKGRAAGLEDQQTYLSFRIGGRNNRRCRRGKQARLDWGSRFAERRKM